MTRKVLDSCFSGVEKMEDWIRCPDPGTREGALQSISGLLPGDDGLWIPSGAVPARSWWPPPDPGGARRNEPS